MGNLTRHNDINFKPSLQILLQPVPPMYDYNL